MEVCPWALLSAAGQRNGDNSIARALKVKQVLRGDISKASDTALFAGFLLRG